MSIDKNKASSLYQALKSNGITEDKIGREAEFITAMGDQQKARGIYQNIKNDPTLPKDFLSTGEDEFISRLYTLDSVEQVNHIMTAANPSSVTTKDVVQGFMPEVSYLAGRDPYKRQDNSILNAALKDEDGNTPVEKLALTDSFNQVAQRGAYTPIPKAPGQTANEYQQVEEAAIKEVNRPRTIEEIDVQLSELKNENADFLREYESKVKDPKGESERMQKFNPRGGTSIQIFSSKKKAAQEEEYIKQNKGRYDEIQSKIKALEVQKDLTHFTNQLEAYNPDDSAFKKVIDGAFRTGKMKDFATFGLTEIKRLVDISKIYSKAEKGGALSPEEKKVLILNENLRALQSLDRGAFDFGVGLQKTLGFMRDMFLTGGLTGGLRAGIGNVFKAGFSQAAKGFGKKLGALALYDAAVTPVMPAMYTEFMRRNNDQYVAVGDENSLTVHKNEVSLGERLYKSYANTFSERFTESLGTMFAMPGVLKAIDKTELGRKFLGNSVEKLAKLKANLNYQKVSQVLAMGGINEVPMETFEEIINAPLQALLLWEKEPLQQLSDPRFYRDVALQSAIIGGAGSIVNYSAAGIGSQIEKRKADRNFIKTAETFLNYPLQDERLIEVRNRLSEAVNNKEFLDENGGVDGSGVSESIIELENLAQEVGDVSFMETAEKFISSAHHHFGLYTALEGIAAQELGDFVYNPDQSKIIIGKDIEDNSYYITNQTDDIVTATPFGGGVPVSIAKSKISNILELDKDQFISEWYVGRGETGLPEVAESEVPEESAVVPDLETGFVPGEKAMFDGTVVKIEDITEDGIAYVVNEEGRLHDIPVEDLKPYVEELVAPQENIPVPEVSSEGIVLEPATGEQEQLPPVPEELQVPVQKDGTLDFDAMLNTDVDMFAREWDKIEGEEGTINYLNKYIENVQKKIDKKNTSLNNETSPNKILSLKKEIQTLSEQRDRIQKVLSERYAYDRLSQQVENPETGLSPYQEKVNRFISSIRSHNSQTEGKRKRENLAEFNRKANEVGMTIHQDNSGNIRAFDSNNNEVNRLFARRQTKEEIQAHPALLDYSPEIQQAVNDVYATPEAIINSNEWTSGRDMFIQGLSDAINSVKSAAANKVLDVIDTAYKNGLTYGDRKLVQESYSTLSDAIRFNDSSIIDEVSDIKAIEEVETNEQAENNLPESISTVEVEDMPEWIFDGYETEVEWLQAKENELNLQNNNQEDVRETINITSEEGSESLPPHQSSGVQTEGVTGTQRGNEQRGIGEIYSPVAKEEQIEREPVDIFSAAENIVKRSKVKKAEKKVEVNPTQAQKEAGNYKKGHVILFGYDITIENPKGSQRSGVDADGVPWSVTMNNTYGYFKGTKGKDGDHIDTFLGDNLNSEKVFVVDQVNPDGSFDEHKVMLGFDTIDQAREAYLSNYSPGWKGLESITETSLSDFKKWTNINTRKQKPFANYAMNANNDVQSGYGAGNKIVTSARYEELKNRMRNKLGQLNTGFDPELFSIGAEMAAYHIEAGARKFSDFSKRMYDDLGKMILPYLKSFYVGAQSLPGMEEFAQYTDNQEIINNFDYKSLEDVYNTTRNSQQDSENATVEQRINARSVLGQRRRGGRNRNRVTRNSSKSVGRNSGESSSSLYPSLFGEPSDNGLHRADQTVQSPGDNAGDIVGAGSGIDGTTGLHDVAATDTTNDSDAPRVSGSFAERSKRKLELQRNAESISIVSWGDLASIEETLPFLLPEQHGDVLKAEDRFFSQNHKTKELANGKGILFTNGTGTGKTYTGLGIIKRFVKQGVNDVLIVVPTQPKVTDWVNDGKNLFLEITPLENTSSAGEGINITTYANFRSNPELMKREFGLVVYDESHRLMEDKNGGHSSTTLTHYKITNKDKYNALQRLQSFHHLWVESKGLSDKLKSNQKEHSLAETSAERKTVLLAEENAIKARLDELQLLQHEALPELEKQADMAVERTKTVFLSATPFKSHFNLRYANGYLFDWGNEVSYQGYSRVDAESRFFLDNFGSAYEWKYHRLQQKSKANADAIALQEMQFADRLMANGVMSGRTINSDKDYSREFPRVNGLNTDMFNKAFSDIFNYTENQYSELREGARGIFYNYNYSTQLFEALKTSMSLLRMQKHLDLGRKVVVFHRRKQANVMPPFASILSITRSKAKTTLRNDNASPDQKEQAAAALRQTDTFEASNKELLAYEQTLNYSSAISQIKEAFGDRAVYINGDISTKDKNNAKKQFNTDGSRIDLIVVQEESGKEGISLHDTSGKHQRVLMNMSMPVSSITALQIEGRIYRIGQESDAIFEYPLLGLDMEIEYFGRNINKRLSTTENMAVGEQSRDLIRSFADGVISESEFEDPYVGQGKGGKEMDRKMQAELSEYRKAVLVYHSNQKNRSKRSQREGNDYYATPEPVGQKMVEWLDLKTEDSVMEPSAGHGAIAMWFPSWVNSTAIEPSFSLYSKLNAKAGGGDRKVLNTTFEDFNIINKFNGIAMNPPFGSGGATAMAHIEKAFHHLKDVNKFAGIVNNGEIRFRLNSSAEEMNTQFNSELQQQIDDTLPKGHIYKLGNPGSILLSAGIPDLPIELAASILSVKAAKDYINSHPFDLMEIMNLPDAIQSPIAVFDSKTQSGSKVILTELKSNDANFVVAMKINTFPRGFRSNIQINDIRSIYPKDNVRDIVNWINRGDLLKWADKNKILNWITQQQSNSAEVAIPNKDLIIAANLVQKFNNPTIREGEMISEIENISQTLNSPVEIIRDVEQMPASGDAILDQKKRGAKGYYNTSTGKVVIILPNAENVEDVKRTMLHEIVAHHGLRDLMGKEFDSFLDQVYKAVNPDIRTVIDNLVVKEDIDSREATEEYLAHLAERGDYIKENRSLWEKIKEWFDKLLSKLGVNVELSDNDLRYFLRRSYDNLKGKGTIENKAKDVLLRKELGIGRVMFRNEDSIPNGFVSNNMTLNWREQQMERVIDRMISVKNIQDVITKRGGKVGTHSNPYTTEFLATSRAKSEIDLFMREMYEPLMENVTKAEELFTKLGLSSKDKSYYDVCDYLYAKHAPERNRKICIDEIRSAAINGIPFSLLRTSSEDLQKLISQYCTMAYDQKFAGKCSALNPLEVSKLPDLEMKILSEVMRKANKEVENIAKSEYKNNRSGMSNDEAAEIIEKFYNNGTAPVLTELSENVKKCTNFTLDTWKKYSLISPEEYKSYKNMYKYYIPLRNWEETEEIDYSTLPNKAFNKASEVVSLNKKAEGRYSKADDPLAFIASLAHTAAISGNKNLIRLNAFRMVVDNKEMIEDLATIEKSYFIEGPEGAIETFVRPAQELFDAGLVKTSFDKSYVWHKTYAQLTAHQVPVIINGQRHIITFKGDIGVKAAAAINNTNKKDFNNLVGKIGKTTRWISSNLTAKNPDFMVTNFARDYMFGNMAYFIEGGNILKLNKNIKKAFKIIHDDFLDLNQESADAKIYAEFKANGGQTGYIHMKDIKQLKKDIDILRRASKGEKNFADHVFRNAPLAFGARTLEYLGLMSENAMRFAVYKTEREKGASAKEAAIKAKEITVNFNRMGTSTNSFSAFYAFFNPTVQGTYRLYNLAKKNPKRFFSTVGTVALMKFAAGLLSSLLAGDDDEGINEYDKLSDYVKFANIVILNPFSEKRNEFIAIPMAQGIRGLTNISDQIIEVVRGNKTLTESLGNLFANIISELSPVDVDAINLTGKTPVESMLLAFSPTTARPFIENIVNQNYLGAKIYKENFISTQEGITPEYKKVYKGTSKILVGTSRWLNNLAGGTDETSSAIQFNSETGEVSKSLTGYLADINPAKVEHVLEGFIGGRFRFFNDLYKTSYSLVTGDDVEINNLPVIHRLYKESYFRPGYKTYYELRDKVSDIEALLSGFKRMKDYQNWRKIYSANVRLVTLYDVYAKQIKQMNDLINELPAGNAREEIEKKRDERILQCSIKYNKLIKKNIYEAN